MNDLLEPSSSQLRMPSMNVQMDTGRSRTDNPIAQTRSLQKYKTYHISKPSKVAMYSTQIGMRLKNLKYLRHEIIKLKIQPYDHQISSAHELLYDDTFLRIVKNMTKKAHTLLRMQLRIKKKPKRRQFSLLKKMNALSYYKKSPMCYKFLSKYLSMPSVATIHQFLNEVQFTSGINPILFEKLKFKMNQQDVPDRVCSIIFGEMPLTPHVSYDSHEDKMHGLATNKNADIATRAIVFMAKGVDNDFKFEQPLAYYFTSDLTEIYLESLIRTVVERAVGSGLIIVSIICNDTPLNVKVITKMINVTKAKYLRRGMDWRHDMIRIKRQIIVPLFNTVNLMKGIRNHLLNKDLVYTMNDEQKVIKWNYYEKLLDSQKSCKKYSILQRLTEEHVNPRKISKRDPTFALQLFSHNVAAVTHYLVTWGQLPQECNNLVDLTLLLDQLFDTLNGDTTEGVPDGKKYKGPLTIKSPHYRLWKEAKTILNTVKFIKNITEGDKIRQAEIYVQPVRNLIKTIEGMETVCKHLYYKFGFKILLTVNLSYTPLEKLFGDIKRHALRRYMAPNTMEFERGFKASMIKTNAYTDYWLREDDEDNGYFQTFNFFYGSHICIPSVDEESDINFDMEIRNHHTMNKYEHTTKENVPTVTENIHAVKENEDTMNENEHTVNENEQAVNKNEHTVNDNEHTMNKNEQQVNENSSDGNNIIICVWILKRYLKNVAYHCQTCRKILFAKKRTKSNFYNKSHKYKNRKLLCEPNNDVKKMFKDIQNLATILLRGAIPKTKLRHKIKEIVELSTNTPVFCRNHKNIFRRYFINVALTVIIHRWCSSVNQIISGKNIYIGKNTMKIAASNLFKQYRIRK